MALGRFGATAEATQALIDLCKEIHTLPADAREGALLSLSAETLRAIRALDYEWVLHGRPEQMAPAEPWRWWVMAGGRGGGKTRAAVEQVIQWAWDNPGILMAFIGREAGRVNRVMIREGIMRRSPPWFTPVWHRTDKLLVWPNGTLAELHSAEEPGTLRGPNYHKAWLTELFHWDINLKKGEKEPEAWREGIKLALRVGDNPQGIIDSSPRRTEFCADLLLGPKGRNGDRPVTQDQITSGEWRIEHQLVDQDGKAHTYVVVCRRWSSERNAEHLAAGIIAEWRHDLRGTALEEQELDGRILVKVEGALWSQDLIDTYRVALVPTIVKVRVAVDPTRADSPTDEAGIVVGGLGEDGHVYVWDDKSMRGSPLAWAKEAIAAKNAAMADAIVLEANRLEESTRQTFHSVDPKVRWVEVNATDGKRTRAEPVSALYEQGRVHHVRDHRDPDRLQKLESEMVSWDPRLRMPSPNRMDALVWLVTDLMGLGKPNRQPLIAR